MSSLECLRGIGCTPFFHCSRNGGFCTTAKFVQRSPFLLRLSSVARSSSCSSVEALCRQLCCRWNNQFHPMKVCIIQNKCRFLSVLSLLCFGAFMCPMTYDSIMYFAVHKVSASACYAMCKGGTFKSRALLVVCETSLTYSINRAFKTNIPNCIIASSFIFH